MTNCVQFLKNKPMPMLFDKLFESLHCISEAFTPAYAECALHSIMSQKPIAIIFSNEMQKTSQYMQ